MANTCVHLVFVLTLTQKNRLCEIFNPIRGGHPKPDALLEKFKLLTGY